MIILNLTSPSFVRTWRAPWALKLILPHQKKKKNHYVNRFSSKPWRTSSHVKRFLFNVAFAQNLYLNYFFRGKWIIWKELMSWGEKRAPLHDRGRASEAQRHSSVCREGKYLKSLCLSNLHFKRLQCTFSSFGSPTLSCKSNLFIWIMMHEGHTTGA